MESILTSIKKVIGIEKDYNHFDTDIIIHANSAFTVLYQLGIGPKEGFMITNSDSVWDDFIEKGPLQNLVRQYVPLKVKSIFDPYSNSTSSDAIEQILKELEWRMTNNYSCEKEE